MYKVSVSGDMYKVSDICGKVDSVLTGLINKIQQLSLSNEQNRLEGFLETLMKGVELLKKWKGTSCFNFFHGHRYGFQINQLEGEIRFYIQYSFEQPISIFPEMMKLLKRLGKLRERYELGTLDKSKMFETFFTPLSKLANDPQQNAMILQQMGPYNTFDGALVEVPCSYVGLEKNIRNLERILGQREVTVVGVHGMGGLGKTTLALALSNDKRIKDVFQNNIIFITVRESPNLKGILETMWKKIVRRNIPEFQNVEEAHRELQQQLLSQAKPTLVILDDVWSRENLEKLLFEGVEYKTLVTTRACSTIPKMTSTQLYELPSLDDDDALPLFCFWAFGQKSIPSTANEHLVKQVQAQCKGLPLALKVIGSSLHGALPPVWESAKKKLLNGETISDYHKCLETSIDVLDEEARECFLDLGSFPADRKIPVNALLDIWVYVRKIERQDAFVILLELASRNLLNLTYLGNEEIEYSEMYFSLHDVMRDLALYMASRDRIVCRKRLFIPRKESLPEEWEQLKDQAFHAQIVSIHTGTMEENQWCKMNFCEAEALVVLSSATNYSLPSFLSEMRELKVLIVFNYGYKRATVKGLPLLSSLAQLKTVRLWVSSI